MYVYGVTYDVQRKKMCKNARGRFDGPQVVARNECLNVGDYHNCIYYVTKWMFVRVYRCCGILMSEWIWNMNIKVNCGVKNTCWSCLVL